MRKKVKRKGKSQTYVDEIDVRILDIVREFEDKNKKPTISEVKKIIGLTSANLVTHINRLTKTLPFLNYEEENRPTIYLSFTKLGKDAISIFIRAFCWASVKRKVKIEIIRRDL